MKRATRRVFFAATLYLACLEILAGQTAQSVIRILDHGAVGDGMALNTQALQKAIAACVENKRGRQPPMRTSNMDQSRLVLVTASARGHRRCQSSTVSMS